MPIQSEKFRRSSPYERKLQEDYRRERLDLMKTMQIVFVSQNYPNGLLQTQEIVRSESRFSPNWLNDDKCMKLTWYSSFGDTDLNNLFDNRPDVVVIVQYGSSTTKSIGADQTHQDLCEVIDEYLYDVDKPRLARMIIEKEYIRYIDDPDFRICCVSGGQRGLQPSCQSGQLIETRHPLYRELLHQTLWDSAQKVRHSKST